MIDRRPPLPRLIATDLDGTLLAPGEHLTPRTRAALDRARSAGVDVVLVTGRPPRWLPDPVAATGITGPVICANGAILYDPAAEQILEHETLDPRIAARIVVAMRAAIPGVRFACEMGLTYGREPDYSRPPNAARWPLPDPIRVDDALALVEAPVTKLLARHPDLGAADLAPAAIACAGADAVVTWSTPYLLEIHGAGVTKAAALARLCAGLGIAAAEVMAFGDMPNDLPMLRWAGVGVAVANAHPDVLAAADAITGSHAEDGVAAWLEMLLDR